MNNHRRGKFLAYFGTASTQGAGGIFSAQFDSGPGRLTITGETRGFASPSCLILGPGLKNLFAASEVEELEGEPTGTVSSFSVDPRSGALAPVNTRKSRGPRHLAVDAKGRFLLVANTRSIAVLPIRADGSLAEAAHVVSLEGPGASSEEGGGACARSVTVDPANRFVYVADSRADKILVYRFEALRGALQPSGVPWIRMDDGVGPCKFVLHGNGRFAYVAGEGDSSMHFLAYDEAAGSLRAIQTLPMLPEEWLEPSFVTDAQVHPSGRFVYGLNRGHDSIAVFSIGESSGTLSFVGHAACGGRGPRCLAFDPSGSHALVANEESGSVSVLSVDQQTGMPSPTGRDLELPAPRCIMIAPSR